MSDASSQSNQKSRQTLRVNIFGEEYPVRATADTEYIGRVAKYVDQKMREIANKIPNHSFANVAVLAALNITDELFKEREDKDKKLSNVEERAQEILVWLDQKLADGQT